MLTNNKMKSINQTPNFCDMVKRLAKIIVIIIIVVLAPFVGGCSPDMALGGLVVYKILWEQENKRTLRSARRPVKTYSKTEEKNVGKISNFTIVDNVESYRDLRWDTAAKISLQLANSSRSSSTEKHHAYFLLGAIAYQQGKTSQAREYFRQSAKRNSKIQPSSELFPPQVISFYQSVRRSGR